MSDDNGAGAGAELTYEPVSDADKGSGAGDVMSSEATQPTRIPGANGYGELTPFDSARGSAAAKLRWERKGEAIRRGVAKAGLQIDTIGRQDDLAVLEAIGENMALAAYDPSNKTAPAAARLVFDHGYPSPAKGELPQVPTGSVEIAEVVALVRQAKAADPALAARLAGLVRGVDGDEAE